MAFHFLPELGPFKLEVYLIRPYRVVFHDFLSEEEIKWMIDYSKPRLSKSRGITKSNFAGPKHEFRDGKRARTVHKTVQVTNYLVGQWLGHSWQHSHFRDQRPLFESSHWQFLLNSLLLFACKLVCCLLVVAKSCFKILANPSLFLSCLFNVIC